MTSITRQLMIFAAATVIACAKADIQSISFTSSAGSYQYDSETNFSWGASASGPPTAYADPGTTNTFLGTNYGYTSGSYADAVTASTSTLALVDAKFGCKVSTGNYSNNYGYEEVQVYGLVNFSFSLDQPGTLVLKAYGTSVTTSGLGLAYNDIYVDGNGYLAGGYDGTFTIPVSAGAHSGYMNSYGVAYAGQYGAYGTDSSVTMSSNLGFSLSSGVVPEPFTLALVGLAGANLVRRRKRS